MTHVLANYGYCSEVSYNNRKYVFEDHVVQLQQSTVMSNAEIADIGDVIGEALPFLEGKISNAQLHVVGAAKKCYDNPDNRFKMDRLVREPSDTILHNPGFCIGDGTGLGKGREIMATVVSLMQGKQQLKRFVWFSVR